MKQLNFVALKLEVRKVLVVWVVLDVLNVSEVREVQNPL